MKVKDLIQQVEYLMGRQPERYMMQLINDALIDIGSTKQHLLEEKKILDSDKVTKTEHKLIKLLDKLANKIVKAREEIEFYKNHDECPTCNQKISEDLKQSIEDVRFENKLLICEKSN